MTQMDPNLITQSRATQPGETPFDVADVFYTRTDSRGVILAANSVFRRISGYDWSELNGAPHKLVRHPDMPKGIFYLMWEELKAGRAVGAYIKNLAKDGRHYWVYAIAAPYKSGFMSVRQKPTGPNLAWIKPLYEDMIKAEAAGASPAASAELIRTGLKDKGFENYNIFQGRALAAEVQERATRLGIPVNQGCKRFLAMTDAIFQIELETAEMTEALKAIRTVPMNMRILASRLENAGGPISAISVNYGSMLDEMATWVRIFTAGTESGFARIRDAVLNGQMLFFVATMQQDFIATLRRETSTDGFETDLADEITSLSGQAEQYREAARAALRVVEIEAMRLSRSVLDMKRYVTGLSSTRMMCKIESATLSGPGDALGGIVDQLDACQNEIETRLARIVELNTVIQNNTGMLKALQ